jgi:hypothetical protein
MCERISFLATVDGPLVLRFAPGLRSHAAARAGWGIPRADAECEWTGETPDSLSVRYEDSKLAATVKRMILDRYPKRSALLATVGETRGPEDFVVQYEKGKPIPTKDGIWPMDLEVGTEDADDYQWITAVSGDVYVKQGATLNAPRADESRRRPRRTGRDPERPRADESRQRPRLPRRDPERPLF